MCVAINNWCQLFVPEVIKRGCWLDGTNSCRKNENAEVCSCSGDLCNDDHDVHGAADDIVEDVENNLIYDETVFSQEESASDGAFQGILSLLLSSILTLHIIMTG